MDNHPWARYEIAHTRHEERVLRGIAAYNALRAHQKSDDPLDTSRSEGKPIRLLDRLLRREPVQVQASAKAAP